MKLALRIDVDTHDGMRDGVPEIRRILDRHGFVGTFFFSFGPDRSGLAVLRAFTKPGFVSKMMRTKATSMYGVRTALSGTLLPSRPIAVKFPQIARECASAGHEVGVHAWDHVAWQDRLHGWSLEKTVQQFDRAVSAFEEVFSCKPHCSAAPAWYALPHSLEAQERHGLCYSTDCRLPFGDDGDPGNELEGAFLPEYGGKAFKTPQIAAGLPTLDELLGRDGWTLERVADVWLSAAGRDTAVITIHAEAEGRLYAPWFDGFCKSLKALGGRLTSMGALLPPAGTPLPRRRLELAEVPGRAGKVCCVVATRATGSVL